MTSGTDRPLASISLPQWMKTKVPNNYDYPMFSPPSDEDGFLLLRYNRSRTSEISPQTTVAEQPKVIQANAASYKPISSLFNENNNNNNITSINDNKNTTTKNILEPGQHTPQCQQFIPHAKLSPRELGMKQGKEVPLQPTGTDDGFTGEGAACGYSIVAVANQMISGKQGDIMDFPKSHQRTRRNSKSLPTSPLSSPKFLRKNQNPFFTNALFGSQEVMDQEQFRVGALTRKLGSFMSVGGNSMNDVSQSTSVYNRSRTDIDTNLVDKPQSTGARVLRAKPSELREMNFWSPTSM